MCELHRVEQQAYVRMNKWQRSFVHRSCAGCAEVCTWVHKFTQVHTCFCQVKETGNIIQSACYASTEQTHYALGAAFSTYKQTPEQTSTAAC